MWAALEAYKDIIGNGLDLTSFLLVTPELVRVFKPLWAKIADTMLYVAVFMMIIVTNIGIVVVVTLARKILPTAESQNHFLIGWVIPALGAIVFSFPISFLLVYRAQVSTWFSKHAFVMGMLLFFISRVVGLIVGINALHA